MTAQLDNRRIPGSATGNQYGTFEVKYGTPAQIKFATRLAAERDTAGLPVPSDFGAVNKRALADWIDTLLRLPEKPSTTAVYTNNQNSRTPVVTEKQLDFLRKLIAEKDWEELASPADRSTIFMARDATLPVIYRREASSLIDWLMTLRRKPVASVAPAGVAIVLEDGMYLKDDKIFKVYHTVHGANQQVAKVLRPLAEADQYIKTVRGKDVTVKAEFDYLGKNGLRGLTPEHRMTLEMAKQYGAVYGVCIRCAATLTDETSIEAQMGPVCRNKI